jgi:hypothetical protein
MNWRESDSLPSAGQASESSGVAGGVFDRRVYAWARELLGDRATALWLIPLGIAAAYFVLFLLRLPHNITEITWDSDYASAFVVTESIAKGASGNIEIASSGQWVSMWFGLLTAWLPLHRELWSIAPTLTFIATALLVGRSVAQISSRRAAILAVLIGLVASPPALAFFLAASAHNTLYICTALLGAYLIYLTRDRERRMLTKLAVPVILGVFVGACLASDLLLMAAAVIPLGATAVLAGLSREKTSRFVALSALSTIAVALVTAKLVAGAMRSLDFLTLETPEKIVPLSELPERARLLFNGLQALFNGTLSPSVADPLHDTVGIPSDVVMCTALLTLLLYGFYTIVKFVLAGLRKPSGQTPSQLAFGLHVIYWTTSALCVCGAFWLAADTGGGTDLHNSYYATVLLSVAAVIPLLLSTGKVARWAIPTGAAIFFAASLIRLTGNYLNLGGVSASTASAIVKAAEANGATSGYGGYGEGSNLTWYTAGRVTSRPVMECESPTGVNLCPFYMESIPSWYVPQQRRTFLLVNSEELWVHSLPGGLGKPIASYTFGPVSMYIYPYDIAARIGPRED